MTLLRILTSSTYDKPRSAAIVPTVHRICIMTAPVADMAPGACTLGHQ